MDDNNGSMIEPVCGTCMSFCPGPLDPNNIGAPRQGECRFGPPTASHVASPQGILKMTAFPVVHTKFPRCGQYHPVPLTLSAPRLTE